MHAKINKIPNRENKQHIFINKQQPTLPLFLLPHLVLSALSRSFAGRF
jgi:hypothetical protein